LKVSERTAGVEYAIRDIITHARAYEKKNGKNVIYLNIGDPVQYDFPTPDHIKNALIKAVQSNENYYTASEGLPDLRQAIVEKEKGKGFDVILSKNVSLTLFNLESKYNIQKMLRIDNKNLIFNDTIKNI